MRSPRRTALGSSAKVVLTPSAVPATLAVVIVNFWPKRRLTLRPASSKPVRILGPWRSARMAMGFSWRAEAWRMNLTRGLCSSGVPWEKFRRAQSMPAAIRRSIISAEVVAGPMVQTIFALRRPELLFGIETIVVPRTWLRHREGRPRLCERHREKAARCRCALTEYPARKAEGNEAVGLYAVHPEGRGIGEEGRHLRHCGNAVKVAGRDLGDGFEE